MSSRLRIIVTGLAGLYPVGGVAWDYLQYVIGLARLGHDVFYYEDTWTWPYNPIKKRHTSAGEYSAHFISRFFKYYAPDLNECWHYRHLHTTSFGMTATEFDKVAGSADLFLNISGACLFPEAIAPNCVKVFLDTDPGYNQIIYSERPAWSENVERWREAVRAHDRHFTYAENIHGSDCLVPKLGFEWRTTRMPVVNALWSDTPARALSTESYWTTVMSWNAFKGKLLYRGVEYKSKDAEFSKLMDLPRKTSVPMMIAMGGVTTPLKWVARRGWGRLSQLLSNTARYRKFAQLRAYGWKVLDGPECTRMPEQYRSFVAQSRGEISTAKHVYVAMKTGWFSCRSACYLAAGKPVVVQDTGFGNLYPVSEGILAFKTSEEALAGIEEAERNYDRHARAAHAIAEEYFSSDRVLTRLVEEAMGDTVPTSRQRAST